MDIVVGQRYNINRINHKNYTVHVLHKFVDLKGRERLVVQTQFPEKENRAPHYYELKIVSPRWFFGMTVYIKP